MPEPTMAVPQISAQALRAKLDSEDQFVLLDVREPSELEAARIEDPRLAAAPMSVLGQLGLQALPAVAQSPDAEIFILCHHGNRSAQVAAWLTARGWKRAINVSGGIDEYARVIDPAVGTY